MEKKHTKDRAFANKKITEISKNEFFFQNSLKKHIYINPNYRITPEEVVKKHKGVSNQIDCVSLVHTFVNAFQRKIASRKSQNNRG